MTTCFRIRASKDQSCNLTQSPLDSKTGAADQVSLRICTVLWVRTSYACVWPPGQYVQALSPSPMAVPWPTFLELAICTWVAQSNGGGRFTGERHLYVGRRVGLSTLAKKFCDPEYPKMSAQSPGMYSPDPVDSSLKGRCVSEWDALKYRPGEE